MIWSPLDVIRTWLDGLCALNLHTGEPFAAPDPLMVEAGKSMLTEEYNSLSSGHGKDAVVQFVRAFTTAGYPLDVDTWLRAYFAAVGTFRHGESVARLVGSTALRHATSATSSRSCAPAPPRRSRRRGSHRSAEANPRGD